MLRVQAEGAGARLSVVLQQLAIPHRSVPHAWWAADSSLHHESRDAGEPFLPLRQQLRQAATTRILIATMADPTPRSLIRLVSRLDSAAEAGAGAGATTTTPMAPPPRPAADSAAGRRSARRLGSARKAATADGEDTPRTLVSIRASLVVALLCPPPMPSLHLHPSHVLACPCAFQCPSMPSHAFTCTPMPLFLPMPLYVPCDSCCS